MKTFLYLFLACAGVCVTIISNAQVKEICANSIDDDLDGFIDCFDGECAKETVCNGGYIGNDLNCEAKPSAFPKFSLALESASEDGTAVHLGRIAVGDIDGDGTPEMITTNQYSKKIFILNGENVAGVNKIQKEITVGYSPSYIDILIGNIDGDKCAEIYTISTGNRLRLYDCNLNELKYVDLPSDPGMMGLADFNGDGKVELYARNAIYNAHTLEEIIAPNGWAYATADRRPNGGPVAVDILNDATKSAHLLTDAIKDDNLELVVGDTIFSVNIASKTLKAEKVMPNYARRTASDATSVADYNLDGSLDVIVSGKNTVDGNTTIFFWDVKTGVVKTYSDPIAGDFTIQNCQGTTGTSTGKYYKNGWHNGTGRVNIADLDGDGKLNVAYVSGKFLYALKDDLTLLWKITVNEETSGNTGCTLFDFNGDGKSEVVYRDEKFIYIIDGSKGTIFTQQPCVSRTNREYPIVADVDADGNTELCVTCRTVDFVQNGTITDPADGDYLKADQADFCDTPKSEHSQVRIFRSGGEPWVPARRVWNQHGYFNVNVNDNLTIPKIQQKHHLSFSENVCTVGKNRPLNSFLNQSPFLNSLGCPKYASPDLAFVDNSLAVDAPTCPGKDFTISFQFKNQGDVTLSGIVPITFYNGDPRLESAKALNTINVDLTDFKVKTVHTVTKASVTGPGSPFTLFIVLNDAGTTIPTPIKLPNTNFIECNYANNVLESPVNPLLAPLTAIKLNDNVKCSPSSTPDNGAVRAFVPTDSTHYNYYWSNGSVAKPIASTDHTGATYTKRPEGTYMVYAIHKTANCYSEEKEVKVGQVSSVVKVRIVLDKPYDNCKNPNPKLRAVVNDEEVDNLINGVGEDPGKYSFTWYIGNGIFGLQAGTGHIISDKLQAIAYTVLVTDKTTNCKTIESFTIQDETVKPLKPTVDKENIDCSSLSSGTASASVGGVSAGYTFDWFIGNSVKPTADFTGPSHQNLAAGTYIVVATRNSTQCTSDTTKVIIGQTIPPIVTASVTAQQTSCDATLPNGIASANVAGDTTNFKFEWFLGQNTLATNRVATTAIAKHLKVATYTVKATSIESGCSDTYEVTINFAVVTPALSLATASHPTQCTPANGSITVAVSPGVVGDYTFSWYNGSTVNTSPDFTDTDNVLSGIPAGTYTVKANFDTRHCETNAIIVTINDNSPVITFTTGTIIPPSDCNDNNGSIPVTVSAPGNTLGFDFEWRKGQEPFTAPAVTTVANTATTTTASSLITGVYTLIVTNRQNGCSTSKKFDLPFVDAHVLSFQSKTPVVNCSPTNTGTATIQLNPSPGYLAGDYIIDVFKGKNDLGAMGAVYASKPGAQNNIESWTALEPGFYTFVAVTTNPARPTFECRSVPITVEIVKTTSDPVFTANPSVNNVNCDGAAGTGQLSISISNPGDYSFMWYEGASASSPQLGTNTSGTAAGATASNLEAGKYTVVVKKINGTSVGCSTTATYQIFDNAPSLAISQAHVAVTDVTRCDQPTMGDISISFVTETPGGAMPTGNYSFEWYAAATAGPTLIPGEVGNTLTNRTAGVYYAKAINASSLCATSGLIEATILNKTLNTVGVNLVSFTIPTNCLRPDIDGRLEVLGSGNGASYTYTWYAGQGTSTSLSAANISGANNEIAQLLSAGFYTVHVLNNTSMCDVTAVYELPLDVRPIRSTASAEPLTVCHDTNKDGTVFATVTGPESNRYNYDWFIETVKSNADFIETFNTPVTNLSAGNYIVRIIDQDDASCFALDTVSVDDLRLNPIVHALPLAPVTTCDPARPDGVATADVDGDIIYHDFDWFVNAPPAGNAFFTGSYASELSAGMYSVIATNAITGCSDTTQVTIDTQQLPVPLPAIEILSMVTSCIADNGALSASVGGNTSEYTFNWHIGTIEKVSPDFTGEFYDSLAVGPYSVTATSLATGCKSQLVTEQILSAPKFPEFSVTTVPTRCTEDSSEPGTGFAALFMTNSVDTDSIFWMMNGSLVATGPLADHLEAGIYEVTVISALGCEVTKTVEVKTEIRPFNGVSRNSDGQNDIFHINCIESFPSNSVKIFNRAGTMVYEAQGYDNNGTYFDGQSNRGVSLMGNNLPGGTYFYIIDKRDGSKPIAGYLEIVN